MQVGSRDGLNMVGRPLVGPNFFHLLHRDHWIHIITKTSGFRNKSYGYVDDKNCHFYTMVDGRIVRVNDYQQSTKSSSKYSLCKDQLDG